MTLKYAYYYMSIYSYDVPIKILRNEYFLNSISHLVIIIAKLVPPFISLVKNNSHSNNFIKSIENLY